MTSTPKHAHLIGLAVNIALAILKLTVGVLAGSEALTADGFNSAGDIFATAIGFAGFAYSQKPPDDDHHFGHGNAENVAGLIIGCVLLATGAFILLRSVLTLFEGRSEPPAEIAMYAALLTMIVKECLYRYAVRVGRDFNSPSLLASARDHRADVVLSLTVAAGILLARLGTPSLDPIAAALVGVYIAYLAIEPIRTNISTLMDQAPPAVRSQVRTTVMRDPDVRRVDKIRIHPLGSYYVVDLEIGVDGALSVQQAEEISHRVSRAVRDEVEHTQDVRVQVRPG